MGKWESLRRTQDETIPQRNVELWFIETLTTDCFLPAWALSLESEPRLLFTAEKDYN